MPHTESVTREAPKGHPWRTTITADQPLDAAPSPEQLLHQQSVLTDFGRRALVETSLDRILSDAARLCAEGTQVPYTKILELLPDGKELVVRAGHGWQPGVVGRVRAPADETNPCGKVLLEERPLVDIHVQDNPIYHLPSIYREYGIRSTVNVLIMTDRGAFGVLEVDTDEERAFTIADVNFLTAFANTLGDAVVRCRREATAERQRLLLQRVRQRMRDDAAVVDATTLAAHLDRLLALEPDGTTALGDHLALICRSIAEIERTDAHHITMECDVQTVTLAADRVLTLGATVEALLSAAVRRTVGVGSGGTIAMRLRRVGNQQAEVAVDSPAGFDPEGLADIRRLVELARGTLKADGGPRVSVTVTL
ncbi:GAF domain-containing protein [Azospirillum soli]|uniref:GAF domain-containing protein n=1 Tax=Azospirillum soli TaxID=1304799 RepID=UPI001AE4E54E|nr:GAF domain-containing protein [Azospirillum soli]MBP2315186.1 GAF domain-containing protein [Azospirillum soli]